MRSYLRKLKNAWRLLRAKLGMKVYRYRPFMNLRASHIGLTGASDVFAMYIAKCSDQKPDDEDPELLDFMKFYTAQYHDSYSQRAQDIFVLFKSDKKQSGSYLEIGGSDGITGSNTLMLHNHFHWNGVLVEPDGEQFRYLQLNRSSGDKLLNVAIAPNRNQRQVALVTVGQLSSIVGYHDKDFHADARAQSLNRRRPIVISAMDINDILSSFNELDYFSLDVEGCEYEILSQIVWDNTVKPRLITVEHNCVQQAKENIASLLEKHGYRQVFSQYEWLTQGDSWFELLPSKAA